MLWLPLQAFKFFFTRPRLFALGVFPGVVTFAASSGIVYSLWSYLLQNKSLWVAVPAMMLFFLVSWLAVGKLSLLPVEDGIIDECQRALWQEVRLPAPPFALKRLAREAFYSLCIALLAILIVMLSLIPFLAPIQFVLVAWLGAYSFLSAVLSRRAESVSCRRALFFEHPISNFLLGAFLNILLFVPVINVFLLGYAQVLATLVFFHREQHRKN